MGLAGKIVEYEWTWNATDHKIFAKEGQLTGKVGGIDLVGSVSVAPQEVTVGGHNRKRYPGGPSISVGGHTRTTLLGGDANRRTLPGENAFIEITTGEGVSRVTDVTQFSFTGPFTELYQFFLVNASVDMVLRSPDGTPYDITPAGV